MEISAKRRLVSGFGPTLPWSATGEVGALPCALAIGSSPTDRGDIYRKELVEEGRIMDNRPLPTCLGYIKGWNW